MFTFLLVANMHLLQNLHCDLDLGASDIRHRASGIKMVAEHRIQGLD